MSSYTPNLNLFKYNTRDDAEEPFDINKALNNNWDKIDSLFSAMPSCSIKTPVTKGTAPQATTYSSLSFNGTNEGTWQEKRLGLLELTSNTDGSSALSMRDYFNSPGSTTNAFVSVNVSPSGVPTCSFSPSFCVDGQWTLSYQTILDGVSLTDKNDTDLLKTVVLPNDGYLYEVIIRGAVTSGTKSGNAMYLDTRARVNNQDFGADFFICQAQTRTAKTVSSRGTVNMLMKYGTNNLIIRRKSGFNDGKASLTVLAYRRMGTNS